jgi:hypothetical protein
MDSGYHARRDGCGKWTGLDSRCGNFREKYFKERFEEEGFEEVHFGKTPGFEGIPLPHPPSECLDWRGVCKNALQNLEGK